MWRLSTCCISTNDALAIEASPLSIMCCSKALICLCFSWISCSRFCICMQQFIRFVIWAKGKWVTLGKQSSTVWKITKRIYKTDLQWHSTEISESIFTWVCEFSGSSTEWSTKRFSVLVLNAISPASILICSTKRSISSGVMTPYKRSYAHNYQMPVLAINTYIGGNLLTWVDSAPGEVSPFNLLEDLWWLKPKEASDTRAKVEDGDPGLSLSKSGEANFWKAKKATQNDQLYFKTASEMWRQHAAVKELIEW